MKSSTPMFLVPAFCFALTLACSSLETTPVRESSIPVIENQKYVMAVQTGHRGMDKILYEHCYRQFSETLPIVEAGEYTGIIEVYFSTSGESAFIGTSSTTSSANAYAQGWYSGYSGFGYATAQGSSTTLSASGSFTWQNSTMLVTIKRKDGTRIWSADYKYKGGWELSGWVVNTPDEAARLCAKRMGKFIASAFKKAH